MKKIFLLCIYYNKKMLDSKSVIMIVILIAVLILSVVQLFMNKKETTSTTSLPAGSIMMWSGTTTDIPTGWAICDGTQGTPDLRGRFIVGVNPADNKNTSFATYEAKSIKDGNEESGLEKVTLTIPQIPAHSHDLTSPNAFVTLGGGTNSAAFGNDQAFGSVANTNNTGQDQPHENRPPFYTMIFIMKL